VISKTRADIAGENKAAATAAAVARKYWREAQERAKPQQAPDRDWIAMLDRQPKDMRSVLTCHPPYADRVDEPDILIFFIPSLHPDFPGLSDEELGNVDQAFYIYADQGPLIFYWSDPWFPTHWMPLPLVPSRFYEALDNEKT
jgi:hypothetical protein